MFTKRVGKGAFSKACVLTLHEYFSIFLNNDYERYTATETG